MTSLVAFSLSILITLLICLRLSYSKYCRYGTEIALVILSHLLFFSDVFVDPKKVTRPFNTVT